MWDDANGVTHKQVKLVRMTVYDTATCHSSTHWQREMLTELEVGQYNLFRRDVGVLNPRRRATRASKLISRTRTR